MVTPFTTQKQYSASALPTRLLCRQYKNGGQNPLTNPFLKKEKKVKCLKQLDVVHLSIYKHPLTMV